MKYFKRKVYNSILILVFVFIGFESFSQNKTAYRQPVPERAIPEIVLGTFQMQYPFVHINGWFVTHITYWQNDISSGWYTDWYGQRTIVVYTYDYPAYFEVEFIKEAGQYSRAIYNLYGYWYETRTQLTGLPLAILESLQKTKYKDWKISRLKEKIENNEWPVDIYRFQVSKGLKSRIIRMDPNGNIIQAKHLND